MSNAFDSSELSRVHESRSVVFFVLTQWLKDELGDMTHVARFCGKHDMSGWVTPCEGGFKINHKVIKELIGANKA